MSRRIGIAAAIWAVGILLSRVIALVREAVFGRIVGGGDGAGLYQAAFTIPDFLNYLLAAGALSIVFIPMFAGYLERGEEERGWRAFSNISTVIGLFLLIATALAWLAVPYVNAWWFAGFGAEDLAQLDAMTRVLLPAQIFHVLGGLLSAALQARDRHALPAMAPLVYTGAIIVGGLVGGPAAGPWGFVWGVLIGSILGPFGLPLVGCLRMGLRYRPRLAWDLDLKRYLWQSLPIMIAFSIIVVDDWLLKGIASGMPEGAVATVTYAKQIMRVPMGVFGLALGAAAYPTLARLVAQGRTDDAYTTLARAMRQMLVLALGAQVVFTVSGAEVARVIYGDRLMPGQHEAIGSALAVFCLALWAWSAHTVLSRGFYARGQTWVPSILGTAVLLVTWPLYGWLAGPMGTTGLAAASSIAVTAYVVLLAVWLKRANPGGTDQFGSFALRIVPALALAVVAGWSLRELFLQTLPGGLEGTIHDALAPTALGFMAGELGAFSQGALVGGIALGLYLVVAAILRVPGLFEVIAMLRRRLPGRLGGGRTAGS